MPIYFLFLEYSCYIKYDKFIKDNVIIDKIIERKYIGIENLFFNVFFKRIFSMITYLIGKIIF